jgi:hypothetical protein
MRADLENAVLRYCSGKFRYHICLIFGIGSLLLYFIAVLIQRLFQVCHCTVNRGGKVITARPDFAERLNVTADFGLINSSDAANDPFRDSPVPRFC